MCSSDVFVSVCVSVRSGVIVTHYAATPAAIVNNVIIAIHVRKERILVNYFN